ncbi:MAG: EF-P lysine aminoacylase GenX [Gammaproteobacteria bacterium]|nr:EF-P lysine aminoacylase GenX [Gammaproteobacteria bacterium]NNC57931.1 EF-P lysine aminoacylase GenX [Woeseiaceae bacterium]NNL50186.1 EF-P lysine aminoacylase GenX [Woeseiaceae bacterium]
MDWRPAAGVQAARDRAAMIRRVRDCFRASNVLEVDTPALSPFAVSDPQIESLEIRQSLVSQRPMFLHTSPEFCMKRLLSAGYPDIFSICRVFRDGESGRQHQPEFTMIEWYRRGLGLREIVDDTLALIDAAVTSETLSENTVTYDYRDAFLRHARVDPLTATIDALANAARADNSLAKSVGNERDDWLDLVFATRIVPAFEKDRLTVVQHYPASQAALARCCPDNAQWADRFEVFFGAVELANGYVELTDAQEQRERIEADNENRRRRDRRVRPYDSALLAALEAGLPACAGVAVGLERLQMIQDRTDDIRDVITFSFEAGA